MKKPGIQALFLFLFLALFAAPRGLAWKVWHHQVIAEIAEENLRPETLREVKYLLGQRYRLADEAGHRLPDDLDATMADFIGWLDDHGDFWAKN